MIRRLKQQPLKGIEKSPTKQREKSQRSLREFCPVCPNGTIGKLRKISRLNY